MNPTLEQSTPLNPNSTPALELVEVSKRFSGKAAVQSLSLNIRQGELYALLGSNGAGKTTTLRMIAGLLEPDSGQISILGHDVALEPEKAKMHWPTCPTTHCCTPSCARWSTSSLWPGCGASSRKRRKRKLRSCSSGWICGKTVLN